MQTYLFLHFCLRDREMTMDYRLIRSKRNSVSVEITRAGEVVVRAPYRMRSCDIESFVCKKQDWIEKHRAQVLLELETRPIPTPEQEAKWKADALREIPPRVAFYAAKMGVRPASVKINGARTRYGSCSSKQALHFSYRLMQFPPAAWDYVVVHELAHIRHFNHSSAFWAEVERYMPDYKERKKLLR